MLQFSHFLARCHLRNGQGQGDQYDSETIDFIMDEKEGPEEIVKSLEMALHDARKRPVILST